MARCFVRIEVFFLIKKAHRVGVPDAQERQLLMVFKWGISNLYRGGGEPPPGGSLFSSGFQPLECCFIISGYFIPIQIFYKGLQISSSDCSMVNEVCMFINIQG